MSLIRLLTLVAALALASPAAAQTSGGKVVKRLPQKFVGMWCLETTSTDGSSTFTREKRCEWAEDEYYVVTPDRFEVAQEVSCKVIKVEAVTKPERFKVKTQCRHFTEKEPREESSWMAIERGRLIITGTNEDGSPKGWPGRNQ